MRQFHCKFDSASGVDLFTVNARHSPVSLNWCLTRGPSLRGQANMILALPLLSRVCLRSKELTCMCELVKDKEAQLEGVGPGGEHDIMR